ncbi:hypothetical protein [Nitrosomonas sp. Is37]|uniref:hypothetical protein n=1 Tax=Nitrosomonas sp. Is37 TaxID=3080535 RepID=UPI00294AEF21|nr:hypothetical protein [Nitrosomonas sp. Is37]MDV6344119.1 hypothetical protein [Nitrosomonas sp. Is37]
METFILKRCVSSLLLLVGLQSLATRADLTHHQQNKTFLSQIEVVMLEELENQRARGGFDLTTINDMNLQAALTGNIANHNVTGANIIDHGAFANSAGMFSVIQNTGNNVLIQDSTIVNVTIMP